MALSGAKVVTTAGTQVALGSQGVNAALLVKALSTNTGKVYVGGPDVDSTNGLELGASESVTFALVGNLANVWIDSAVNGEGVRWLILEA